MISNSLESYTYLGTAVRDYYLETISPKSRSLLTIYNAYLLCREASIMKSARETENSMLINRMIE